MNLAPLFVGSQYYFQRLELKSLALVIMSVLLEYSKETSLQFGSCSCVCPDSFFYCLGSESKQIFSALLEFFLTPYIFLYT